MSEVDQIKVTVMRGGTSKGLFVRDDDLPADPAARDRTILRLFGTPDKRQIDGLGGADLLTSKLAIIGEPTRSDADIDYTFVQVGVEHATLDYSGNCGNISAAVGPYAIQEGMVYATLPLTTVRIHNTNTGKVLTAHVPVDGDGEPQVEGDCVVDGVPGSGARITLDYSDTAGAVSGAFFPTGNLVDHIENVPGIASPVRVTLTDLANPVVYVTAADLGLTGVERPEDCSAGTELNARLEHIRSRAAVMFGMVDDWQEATVRTSTFPLLTVVAPPTPYVVYGGTREVAADEVDLVVRMFTLLQMHKAYAGTGTANLGPTALVPGTVVHEVARRGAGCAGFVTFGHPTGVSRVDAAVERTDTGWVPVRAVYERTARRLMAGEAFVRRNQV